MAKKILTPEQKAAKRAENSFFRKLQNLQRDLAIAKINYPSQVTNLEIRIYQLKTKFFGID